MYSDSSFCKNQIQEVLRKYESKREIIYKELEIAYVQEKVRKKLLKESDDCVEFLFYDEEQLPDSSFRNLISGSQEAEESEIDLQTEYMEPSRQFTNQISDKTPDKIENNDPCNKKKIPHLSQFLDLEAEYSGEEEYEELEEVDLEGIIDNDVDNNINLQHFAEEREKRGESLLKKLKKKFIKKTPKEQKNITIKTLDLDSIESFPEIEEIEIEEFILDQEVESKVKNIALAPDNFNVLTADDNCSLFNNNDSAIERLSKKEEKRSTGYYEKID